MANAFNFMEFNNHPFVLHNKPKKWLVIELCTRQPQPEITEPVSEYAALTKHSSIIVSAIDASINLYQLRVYQASL
jgi:hypothetical protein